jgi:hypothetical protein
MPFCPAREALGFSFIIWYCPKSEVLGDWFSPIRIRVRRANNNYYFSLRLLVWFNMSHRGSWVYFGSQMSHPVFKTKTRCSSYVCPGSSCHTYGQNVSTEYQCLYYIVSYYKNLLQVQKGLSSGMDPILPHVVDRGFRTPRRNLHQHTPHLLSSRT